MKKAKLLSCVSALALLLQATCAYAEHKMNVTGKIEHTCAMKTNDLPFGDITEKIIDNKINEDISKEASIDIKCTNGTEYKLILSAGENPNTNNKKRSMIGINQLNKNDILGYFLYRDKEKKAIWWDDDKKIHSGTGDEREHIMYGVIPAGKVSELSSGLFRDAVVASLVIIDKK